MRFVFLTVVEAQEVDLIGVAILDFTGRSLKRVGIKAVALLSLRRGVE